jgi:hypothetical protein
VCVCWSWRPLCRAVAFRRRPGSGIRKGPGLAGSAIDYRLTLMTSGSSFLVQPRDSEQLLLHVHTSPTLEASSKAERVLVGSI